MKRYALLVPSLILAAACGREEPGEVRRLESMDAVRVSAVAAAPGGAQMPARVVAWQTANLATRGSGTVESVPVDVGSTVQQGQILVRLEGSGVDAAVARADAQTAVARRTYERIANLQRDGAATRQELDQAEAELHTAEAALEEARASRDYFVLRAPFDGTVTARHVDPGDLAVPGQPMLVVSGAGDVKVEADLPSSLSGAVEEGSRVAVVQPGAGARWPATVRRVVRVLDLTTHRFRVEAVFEGQDGLPAAGSYVRLEVPAEGRSSNWVPEDAIVRRGQLTGVYEVADGELRLRWIRTGRRTAEGIEVLAGLSAGDLVVRAPAPGLLDGTTVGATELVAWSPAPEGER